MKSLLLLSVWISLLVIPILGQLPIFGLQCLSGQPTGQGTFLYSFRVTITNPRPTPITDVTVTLQQPQAFVGNVPAIPGGATQTLLGTVTTSSSSPRIGPAILSARTSGPNSMAIAAQSGTAQCPPAGPGFTTQPPRNVDLRVTKNCTANVVRSAGGGQEIEVCFDIFVTNTGNVPFTSISVVENIGAPLFQPVAAQALPVGATIRLSGCFTPNDQNAQFFTNTASVFATAQNEVEAREFGPAVATCPRPTTAPNVDLQVTKNCSARLVGNELRVFFDIFVTNVGNVPFVALTVVENVGFPLFAPQSAESLPVGATLRFSGSYTPTNPNAPFFNDTVSVFATAQGEFEAREFGPAIAVCPNPFFTTTTTTPPTAPQLSLDKNCTVVREGNRLRVLFNIFIRNTGNVPFSALSILEQELGGAAPQTFVVSSGLAVGSRATVSGSYVPSNQNAASFTDEVRVVAQPSFPANASPIQFGPVSATCPNPFF